MAIRPRSALPGRPTNMAQVKTKQRNWEAYVSVAASGSDGASPQYGHAYPKEFAQLKYTSKDVDYWAGWWEQSWGPAHTLHEVRHEADYTSVTAALDDVGRWLCEASVNPDFDGGSIVFCYSGHGRENDGALSLNQGTCFDADDFVNACLEIQQACLGDRRLRIGLILDSCYSGAFLLNALETLLHEHGDRLYPDYFYAACMPDEQAWELPAVEHGLATHSRILQAARDFDEHLFWPFAAGDDSLPIRDLIVGERGCAYVTAAAQNPVIFGEYDLQVGQEKIEVWTDYNYDDGLRSRKDWEAELLAARNRFRGPLADLVGGERFSGELLDPAAVADLLFELAKKEPEAAKGAWGIPIPSHGSPPIDLPLSDLMRKAQQARASAQDT